MSRAVLFDTAAADYAKYRPGYPAELYAAIQRYKPLGSGSLALEVGIGGGQATYPIIAAGCTVTAIESGAELAGICAEKYKDCGDFSVMVTPFEDAPLPDGAYDIVYSASAFHWIPEEAGYRKVYRILKRGGAFARFANRPYPCGADAALSGEIESVYAKYYYPYHKKQPSQPEPFTAERAAELAQIAERYGFTDIQYYLYRRTLTYTAAEYTKLLGTYSDHIAIAEPTRLRFFAAIEQVIEAHGGTIAIDYTSDLELARKP